MSDVAVTWAKAQDPVDAKGRLDRNAKDILKTMAPWADAEGEVWAAVAVLAMECACSERTVQRALKTLKACGLLIETGATKTYNGRVYPMYRMPVETGHASTVRRLKAEREAARQAAWGDTDVTPTGDFGVTPVSPQDVTDVTPRGDTGVTLIGKEITQGLKPSASVRASEVAGKLWAGKAPERVAPVHVERAWLDAVRRTGESDARLLSAVRAAVSRDPDFGRGKAMNLDRWLDEGRFMAWLPDDGAVAQGPAASGWMGPDTVRAAVEAAMGTAAVASYLAPATWDEGLGAIVAATRMAADRLREGAGRALKALGVTVMTRGAAHG